MKPEKIYIERMHRFADMLRREGPYKRRKPIPQEAWNMYTWGTRNSGRPLTKPLPAAKRTFKWFKNAARRKKYAQPGECGTAACALGYAAFDPWFNKRGLSYKAGNRSRDFFPVLRSIDDPSYILCNSPDAAGIEFFGLQHGYEDKALFHSYSDSPKQIGAKARKIARDAERKLKAAEKKAKAKK